MIFGLFFYVFLVLSCVGSDETTLKLSGSAAAMVAKNPETRLMTVLDRDGDGKLSKGEYENVAFPKSEIAHDDKNDDGFIDVAELRSLVLTKSPLVESRRSPKPSGVQLGETE